LRKLETDFSQLIARNPAMQTRNGHTAMYTQLRSPLSGRFIPCARYRTARFAFVVPLASLALTFAPFVALLFTVCR
jgi:hypothetical protein